jgi:hypothetical protein
MAAQGPKGGRMQHANRRAAWTVGDLQADSGWIFELDDRARRDLTGAVRNAADPAKTLFDYRRDDFNLGSAWPVIAAALREVRDGTGFAILRGMPREGLTADEFELLTWAIGLHTGVARPQGKSSQFLSAVRDAGTVYRTGKGRGYSSNADLDFHTDSADIVLLTCYNVARSGGMSMVSSSVAAHEILTAERPDLAELLHQPHYFSRQQEQAPDEAPFYPNPIYDQCDGRLFSKWNRNRLRSAQAIKGVPPLEPRQRQALDLLDDILRRPSVMHSMYLRPGDIAFADRVRGSRRPGAEAMPVPAVAGAAGRDCPAGKLASGLPSGGTRVGAGRDRWAGLRRRAAHVRGAAGGGSGDDAGLSSTVLAIPGRAPYMLRPFPISGPVAFHDLAIPPIHRFLDRPGVLLHHGGLVRRVGDQQ